MTYKIQFSRAAAKELQEIPGSDLKKLSKKIEKLAENPLPPGHEKLKGKDAIYRIRQGDYRILYSIFDKTCVILIVKIGHRREVYR